jgi:hypothetical protein
VRIVVVLDSCTDATHSLIQGWPGVEILTTAEANVGHARALGTAHLLRTTPGPREELWLANTDADSAVPASWLSTMVAEGDAGARILLGTVLPLAASRQTERAWRGQHVLRDGHPHIHGANLGLRADAYICTGGWSALATGEDIQLARRVVAAGHAVLRTAQIPVNTSARTKGRAPHGFAGYLSALEANAGACTT